LIRLRCRIFFRGRFLFTFFWRLFDVLRYRCSWLPHPDRRSVLPRAPHARPQTYIIAIGVILIGIVTGVQSTRHKDPS
jgi:hypothetical protein